MEGLRRQELDRQKGRFNRQNKTRYKIVIGEKIDYKNINLLKKFLTERGKICSRRMTGVTAKQQRELSRAITRARFLGLILTGARRK